MSVLMYVLDHLRARYFKHGIVPASAAVPSPEMNEMPSRGGSSKVPARVRMEFPETWLWSDSVTGYCPALQT